MLEEKNISTIFYIPLATKQAKISSAIEWFNNSYGSRLKNIHVWKDAEEIRLGGEFKGAMYFGGGNTYLLMDLLKKAGVVQDIKDFILSGGVVYGGSAGAIIMGRDIGIAPESKEVNLNDLGGLDLLNGFSVWPHYKEGDDILIEKYIKLTGNNVIAIPENGGVLKNEDKLISYGSGEVFLFDPYKRKLN